MGIGQAAKKAIWALAACVALTLAGLIGYHTGFAGTLGVTGLRRSAGLGIVDGIWMLGSSPARVFEAGVESTSLWAGAMLIGAVGAALLAIAIIVRESDVIREPTSRGEGNTEPATAAAGPDDGESAVPPSDGVAAAADDDDLPANGLGVAGAVLSLLVAALQFAWLWSRYTSPNLALQPWTHEYVVNLESTAAINAGLDVVAVVASGLWLAFAFWLPTGQWLRRFAKFAWLLVLLSAALAASVSSGRSLHLGYRYMVVTEAAGSNAAEADDALASPDADVAGVGGHANREWTVVGRTENHFVAISGPVEVGGAATLRLIPDNVELVVTGYQRLSELSPPVPNRPRIPVPIEGDDEGSSDSTESTGDGSSEPETSDETRDENSG
jgi:uncharacterized membrane protein YbaN (DUF454 family)